MGDETGKEQASVGIFIIIIGGLKESSAQRMGMEKGASLLFIDVGHNLQSLLRIGAYQKREGKKALVQGEGPKVRGNCREEKGSPKVSEFSLNFLITSRLDGLSDQRPSVLLWVCQR